MLWTASGSFFGYWTRDVAFVLFVAFYFFLSSCSNFNLACSANLASSSDFLFKRSTSSYFIFYLSSFSLICSAFLISSFNFSYFYFSSARVISFFSSSFTLRSLISSLATAYSLARAANASGTFSVMASI